MTNGPTPFAELIQDYMWQQRPPLTASKLADDADDADDRAGVASSARRVFGLTGGEWRYVLVVGTVLGLLLLGFVLLLMHAGS